MSTKSQRERPTDDDQQLEHVRSWLCGARINSDELWRGSASWLNLVERCDEMTRKRIRRRTCRSSLIWFVRSIEYVAHHNRHAEPFIWTATAATILRKVRRCKGSVVTGH